MSDESFNPYASPMVGTALSPPERVRGYGRLSESSLKTAIGLMIICEMTFAAGWLLFVAGMVASLGWGFDYAIAVAWGSFVCFLIAWVITGILMIQCREIGMLLIALFVPFPLLGSLAFLACINHTRQTFLVNGYTPGFLGASPDEAEREAMAAEPFYRPSLKFDRQGEKRSLRATLSHIVVAIAALGYIALLGLG